MSWTGHVWRSEGLIGQITMLKPNTKRPRQKLAEGIKNDLRISGVKNPTARDREENGGGMSLRQGV